MATGTTLCLCNRMADPAVYGSLGIREGVHVAMFDTLAEFVFLNMGRKALPQQRFSNF